jgi:tetratricopeptide (TPR) repeat protein
MGIFLRLLFLAAFSWVGFVLYSEAEEQAHLDEPDNSKVVLLFGGTILDGAAIATMLALWVVPAIGEGVGGFFFNPGAKVEHDAHADAIAKLAQGDPEGAIEQYQEILAKDPSDTLCLSEIARICCRDLGDTARAAATIEQSLESEWPPQQSSFLANRLADIYLLQDDPMRARQVIIQVAEAMEGTKFAANAQHRLREIERAIETGVRAPAYSDDLESPRTAKPIHPSDALPAPEDSDAS